MLTLQDIVSDITITMNISKSKTKSHASRASGSRHSSCASPTTTESIYVALHQPLQQGPAFSIAPGSHTGRARLFHPQHRGHRLVPTLTGSKHQGHLKKATSIVGSTQAGPERHWAFHGGAGESLQEAAVKNASINDNTKVSESRSYDSGSSPGGCEVAIHKASKMMARWAGLARTVRRPGPGAERSRPGPV